MRILLIEDEKPLAQVIKNWLTEQGFAVDEAFDGEEGLYLAESESYDVIILDVMLPKIDGVTVCKELRSKKVDSSILMLTAKTHLNDKVVGLNAGADDYLAKPFEFEELKARINALLRRGYKQPETVIKIDDLEIDPAQHIVKRGDKSLVLTPKEFAVLEFLARHKDEVVTRTQIMEHTWDYNFNSMSNVVDVYIATLRRKIDGGQKKKLIQTIFNVGYKLSDK
ncbi:MAG: response regulator transcription factor [Actinobacteria bacterium]|nr:response regulator transcription factor [Actinomycetota bacterium]MCL5073742.1 response regulator transcription factor [Actinomycetota bacterium]